MGLVALRHVGSSWTRNRTCVFCIGRQILTTGSLGKSQPWCLIPCLCPIQTAWPMFLRVNWRPRSLSLPCKFGETVVKPNRKEGTEVTRCVSRTPWRDGRLLKAAGDCPEASVRSLAKSLGNVYDWLSINTETWGKSAVWCGQNLSLAPSFHPESISVK